jgi:Fe-S cluster assembly protein SufD
MTTVADQKDTRAAWVADFERFVQEADGDLPGSVPALRRRGIERFDALGFPTLKQEEWRFTNVAPIARTAFQRAEPGTHRADGVTPAALEPFLYPDLHRLVFVDGFFVPELSDTGGLPEGVIAGGLGQALKEHPELVEPYLGRIARIDEHPFAALNTAFLRDGAFLHVPKGAVVDRPFHLLFVSTVHETPRASMPRNLFVLGEASQSLAVESYVTLGTGAHFTCSVTEVEAGPGAVMDHYRVQQESREAFHMAMFQIHQERDSNIRSHTVTTGGALVRNDTGVVLDGEGGDCTLNGLYVINGSQMVDNHMRVEHAKPHCDSYELFKGILDQKARAVFNGRIYVHKGAQKTDAKQSNRNLLLSPDALVNSNPQLEIFADDVKCTHGSTVGQLDRDAVYYLRSRGIAERAARSILTYAFASDIIEHIKVEPVREELAEFLFTRLPEGEVVRQAV